MMNTIMIAAACVAAGFYGGLMLVNRAIAYALRKRILVIDNTNGRMIVGRRQKDGSYKWRAKW